VTREIILTPIAEAELEQITDYLYHKWNNTVVSNFIDRFKKVCRLLLSSPEIYPYINKSLRIQKCVLSKHNTIFFIEEKEAIYILRVFDTRQSPDKISGLT
jgi:plasmid stabilization system protein ParE